MSKIILYLDETGNRNPDKKCDQTRHGRDWFALGGILVLESDLQEIKKKYNEFCKNWNIKAPLHFTDMQSQKKAFSWLGKLKQAQVSVFWQDYRSFLSSLPIIGTACVIDRGNYRSREYTKIYGENRWLLCKSAFDILIERSTKYAISRGCKLSVVFEGDIAHNEIMKNYFSSLKTNGLEFSASTSQKYNPLNQMEFATTLGTIEYKLKNNIFLQIADTIVYSIARQKYDRNFHVFRELRDRRKIINFSLENTKEIQEMGIKYYCF